MRLGFIVPLVCLLLLWGGSGAAAQQLNCGRTIEADIVAIDQPIFLNRLGASMPGGMIYALRRDIVAGANGSEIAAGNAQLNSDRRPRPLVLRVRVGDCLHIQFQNLLSPTALPNTTPPQPCQPNAYAEQTCTREAGVHIFGMEETVANGTLMDGSFVGTNPSSLVPPSGQVDYTVRAPAEGVFLMYSTAANAATAKSGGGLGGQLSAGLFGSVVVEPATSEWYRSQVTKVEMDAATKGHSADGHPVVNYAALRREQDGSCTPILRMVDVRYKARPNGDCVPTGRDLVTYHGDLTAIVTGPNAGPFPPQDTGPSFTSNPVEPNRHEPFREFVQHYHDVLTATQAFPALYNAPGTSYVLGNGGEAFAINYGAAGIGSEILANRLGVGPEGGCVECRFEEFFLSSWAVGDPAMLVSSPDGLKPDIAGPTVPYQPKTTLRTDDQAQYPDDPSNVYHSYIGDRVIFRIVHAGQLVTHLHHLHAHQWLHTPNSDTSTYLDSQLISPGSTFTQEIDYEGSGNRNRTPGDAIFHCHFYPHFAAGMWGLWRNHDVFEAGTDLAGDPTRQWNRALPDGEFLKGTPIPSLMPLPTLPMAPLPARTKLCPIDRHWDGSQVLDTDGNCPSFDAATAAGEVTYVAKADFDAGRDPGFPFYIPGIAGQRTPHPPLGYASDSSRQAPGQTAWLDGGLARHITVAGEVSNDHYNAWDFSKDLDSVVAIPLAEGGTPLEQLAMQVHSTCTRDSFTPEGRAGKYVLNGGPSVPGAPYANPSWGSRGNVPCVDLADPAPPSSDPKRPDRVYKAADVQMDVVFNKVGWHYPQLRFETLWQDVMPTLAGKRAPEPLFIRANSGETIEFWQTNLVPAYYELDDFQVRTPTDVIGQHIHLVKFDVTSSDGAANGYNYEAGSSSPDAVREEIAAIRKANNCAADAPISFQCPVAKAPPADVGKAPAGQDWTGAQTTVERWWADPVMDSRGVDRTLRTVFTHDHFSPSTHQQAGLYSGLLVEPKASKWRIAAMTDPATGQIQSDIAMGARPDGGPTSWAADVITPNPAQSYREFAIEFQDIQLAYTNQSVHQPVPYPCLGTPAAASGTTPYDCAKDGAPDGNTTFWGWASQANALNRPGPPPTPPTPQLDPQLISVGVGVSSVNYRSEPLPLRVAATSGTHDPTAPAQDLALSYASIQRENPALNVQPPNTQKLWPDDPASTVTYPGGFIGAGPEDPYTPLLRAYPKDQVQVRVLVGAHELNHSFAIHGVKWLAEPSYPNSGHLAAQPMGISEHFELLFTLPPGSTGAQTDYLYQPDANFPGQQDGLWGIMRAYNTAQADLPALPNNKPVASADGAKVCPDGAPQRAFEVSVVTAARALPGGTLTYNARSGPITQPDAILYVLSANLDANSHLKSGVPIEPLILRAAAGDCIHVTLNNLLDPAEKDINGQLIFNNPDPDTYPPSGMTPVSIYPSARAGLHAQQLEADVVTSDGTSVGSNPNQTAAPNGGTIRYTWYAGKRDNGKPVPAELGVVNLLPADPIEQPLFGAVGALVIEPPGATWRTDAGTAAAATVFAPPRLGFREFVGVWQTQIDCTYYPPAPNCQGGSAPSAQLTEGLNYRAEPLPLRVGSEADISNAFSDTLVSPQPHVLAADPQTPVFWASSGMPVRFRFVNPGGQITLAEVFGHHWQEEPWRNGSTRIGDNPLSQTMGAVILGSSHALNLVVDQAGAPGDYLYRNFIASPGNYAMWGLFRVGPLASDVLALTGYERVSGGGATLTGYVTPDLRTQRYARRVALVGRPESAPIDPATGRFQIALKNAPATVTARSASGGEASAALAPAAPAVVAAVRPQALVRATPTQVEQESLQVKKIPATLRREASAAALRWRRFVAAGLGAFLAQGGAALADQRFVEQGVAMDVTTEPLGGTRTGQDLRLTVRLSDAASGTPLAGANPAAWLSLNRRGSPPTEPICRREVAAYLGGNPFVRPDVDLTGFILAVINRDPTVTVLDPQGGFGGSRMLAMLRLESPGVDVAVGVKPPRLYVTEPAARRLEVIDTERWQQPVSVALADPPAAVLLQHDGLRLWVAAARDGAVTAMATNDLAVAARIPVGGGAHLLAMTGDDHRLLVTNQAEGSVTAIDPQGLAVVATVSVGAAPRAMAMSALAGLAYVAVADSIAVVDPARGALTGRIDGVAGASAMAISPDGRWGFAANPDANQVFIFDTSTNHLVQTMTVENAPFQIAFTDSEAYIRRRDSEAVTLVPLAPLRAEGHSVGHGEFPAGEKPVAAIPGDPLAPSMVAVPGEASMLLASPAERAIHYYHEGMAAPTDSFDDLGHQPSALGIVDRSLRQAERGTYTTTARLPRPGVYDLTLLLDSPRVAHCFAVDATSGFGASATAARLDPVTLPRAVPVGSPVALAFRATRSSVQPVVAKSAVATALVILSPGSWYQRVPIVSADDGIWRLEFIPPRAGTYLLAFDAPDLGLDVDSGPHFTLEAVAPPGPGHE